MTTSITAVIDSPPELEVVAGVDTHADTYYVAVLSGTGTRLGDLQVPARTEGCEQLLAFIRSFGSTRVVGIEGTSSYGAGLARYLMSHGVEIREVALAPTSPAPARKIRSDRRLRRRCAGSGRTGGPADSQD